MSTLILASTSIYKKMLLQRLQLPFSQYAPKVTEHQLEGEAAFEMAGRLADDKALAIAKLYPNAVVIGADQTGELDGQLLGKPNNHKSAFEQLSAQSGRTSKFHCGVSVAKILSNGEVLKQTKVNTTEVTFRALNKQQIAAYLHADKPYDCAGSFKAEGRGISLFTEVKSNDPSSLVGLPLIDLCTLLGEFGIDVYQKTN
jgi:septum formation protein